jgi:hypothetical protein
VLPLARDTLQSYRSAIPSAVCGQSAVGRLPKWAIGALPASSLATAVAFVSSTI